MNKKGFTLVELLSVIVVLAIVMAIAVPSVIGVNSIIKNNMLDSKVEFIEEAAVLFGQDIKGSVMSSGTKYKNYPCKEYIVSDLVPQYLSKDNENNCLNKESSGNVGCIVDPRDESNYLDKYKVIIYFKNKRIRAIVDTDNTLSCS